MTRQPGWSVPHPDQAEHVARIVSENPISPDVIARLRSIFTAPPLPEKTRRRPQ